MPFLIHPVSNVFDNNFDVGLTHRHIVGQMPINEGVIFANTTNKAAVVKFQNLILIWHHTLLLNAVKKLQKFTKTSEDGVEGSWLLTRQQVGFNSTQPQ